MNDKKGGIMFKFDNEFFTRQRMLNVDREWLIKDLGTVDNNIITQLIALLREGNREKIRMAKDFIQETLDGVRRLDLTVQINNDRNLSPEEKDDLLYNFVHKH